MSFGASIFDSQRTPIAHDIIADRVRRCPSVGYQPCAKAHQREPDSEIGALGCNFLAARAESEQRLLLQMR